MSARRRHPLRQINALRGLRAGWRGRVAVLLAGFFLLLQALLPWSTEAAARANAANAPDWIMASLCVAHDTDSQVPAHRPVWQDPASALSSCAICLGLHCAGAFVPPQMAALSPPTSSRPIDLAEWRVAAPGDSYRTASRARAPPATV